MRQELVRFTCDRCERWVEQAAQPDWKPVGWRVLVITPLSPNPSPADSTTRTICASCLTDCEQWLRDGVAEVADADR